MLTVRILGVWNLGTPAPAMSECARRVGHLGDGAASVGPVRVGVAVAAQPRPYGGGPARGGRLGAPEELGEIGRFVTGQRLGHGGGRAVADAGESGETPRTRQLVHAGGSQLGQGPRRGAEGPDLVSAGPFGFEEIGDAAQRGDGVHRLRMYRRCPVVCARTRPACHHRWMPAKTPSVEVEADGHTVTVTNPDKVFFATRGETKLDLVRYYLAVGPGALVGVRDRPTVLKRFPHGAEGEFFYQKRVPTSRPSWIETVTVAFPSGRFAEELCPVDVAHIAWAANLGCLDSNPWPVRRDDVDHPDEFRVDLDPQPGVSFDAVRAVALEVRALLEEHGLTGYPKTSGSRGLHINVRIERRWDFTEVRRAALALARAVERRMPTVATSAWWKEQRGDRVFIDYNQNARDRTVASAYSVRANPEGAGVVPARLGRGPRRRTLRPDPGHGPGPLRRAGRPRGGDRRRALRPRAAPGPRRARRGRGTGGCSVAAALRQTEGRTAPRRAGSGPPTPGHLSGSGPEDGVELLGHHHLELGVGAGLGRRSGRQRRKVVAWRNRSPWRWS